MNREEYEQFLARKMVSIPDSGFDPAPLPEHLFEYQRDIVSWAVRKGRCAVFADCGLGKTPMQLEWAAQVAAHTGLPVLILAPLAVVAQTQREGEKFNVPVNVCRSQDDVTAGVNISNYEMLDHFVPGEFGGVVLDESSVLKTFTGKTKRQLIQSFESTPYKLACTATPAPNDHKELGNHAEFLGIGQSNEMLARWFSNNTMKAGDYTLKPWARDDFWNWVTSWAVCLGTPSDIGHSDDGFILPELQHIDEMVRIDHTRAFADGQLFVGGALSSTDMWREKRHTAKARVERAVEIVKSYPGEPIVVWCETNMEADLLKSAIPGSVEVRGADSPKVKADRINGFSRGDFNVIITKPKIAGFGLNWQHCARVVFVGVTYSFESYYQAIRRCWRFGQTRPVQAHIVYAETEGQVITTIERKKEAHKEMQREMSKAMNGGIHSLKFNHLTDVEEDVATGDGWELRLGDCVTSMRFLEDDSVGFTVFSPPFKDLYVYSDSVADMGNSDGDDEFFAHFGCLVPELLRVTKPGRLCAVHCKDLPLYKNRDGAAGLYDFPGQIVSLFESHGWTFHSRVTIWKDPVTEMQRTKNHGLLHKNFTARREVVRQGMADYVMVFRKWTPDMEDCQIDHAPVPGEYIGDEGPAVWDSNRDWSIQTWQRYASPVWFDINQTRVLNRGGSREEEDEKHICPLQLDVIERCVWLWSNPGDLVVSPFAGIGSEGYQSLKMDRRFFGVELKKAYWTQAVDNLIEAATPDRQLSLLA